MLNLIFILIGFIICAVSTTMCFDARNIATKRFSSKEINEATKAIKKVGCILSIIACLIVYFSL